MTAFKTLSLFAIILLVTSSASAVRMPDRIYKGAKLSANSKFSKDAMEQQKLLSESYKMPGDVECSIGFDFVIPDEKDLLFEKETSIAFMNDFDLEPMMGRKASTEKESIVQIGFTGNTTMVTCRSMTRKVTPNDVHSFLEEVVGLEAAPTPTKTKSGYPIFYSTSPKGRN